MLHHKRVAKQLENASFSFTKHSCHNYKGPIPHEYLTFKLYPTYLHVQVKMKGFVDNYYFYDKWYNVNLANNNCLMCVVKE